MTLIFNSFSFLGLFSVEFFLFFFFFRRPWTICHQKKKMSIEERRQKEEEEAEEECIQDKIHPIFVRTVIEVDVDQEKEYEILSDQLKHSVCID